MSEPGFKVSSGLCAGSRDEDAPLARFVAGRAEILHTVADWIDGELYRHRALSVAEREDLFQEVHRKLLEIGRRGTFRGEASFKTFVVRIARYTIIDYLRRRGERPAPSIGESHATSETPEHRLRRREAFRGMVAAIGRSSPQCRVLLHLVFVERLSYREVAARLGIPEGTVKSRIWHCRRRLEIARREWESPGP